MPYKLTGCAHFSNAKNEYTKGQVISDAEYKALSDLGKSKFSKVVNEKPADTKPDGDGK